jgi:hypothetical protein
MPKLLTILTKSVFNIAISSPLRPFPAELARLGDFDRLARFFGDFERDLERLFERDFLFPTDFFGELLPEPYLAANAAHAFFRLTYSIPQCAARSLIS